MSPRFWCRLGFHRIRRLTGYLIRECSYCGARWEGDLVDRQGVWAAVWTRVK
jgi:hypothetical protein